MQGGFGSPPPSHGRQNPNVYADLSYTLDMPQDPLANLEGVFESEGSHNFGNSWAGAGGSEPTDTQQLSLWGRPRTRSVSRLMTPEHAVQQPSEMAQGAETRQEQGYRQMAERRRPMAIHTITSREATFQLGGGMEENQQRIPGRLPECMDIPRDDRPGQPEYRARVDRGQQSLRTAMGEQDTMVYRTMALCAGDRRW